ncbi:MAG: RluA family pseudouridine synthase [Moraxella sp.]|nr:RluA family pseudouridine synthase [Moraxella sp.]
MIQHALINPKYSDVIEDGDNEFIESEQDDGRCIKQSYTVAADKVGQRLDKVAASVFTEFSRAILQGFISEGELTVNGKAAKPKQALKLADVLLLQTMLTPHDDAQPENIPLAVVYEDDSVLVIDKPAGLVVHPGAGNATGTLVNALLYHYPNQAHLPRAGLVHRIDKDTTGLLIIAKTASAQLDLTRQLKDKSVYRHYQCVVAGNAVDIAKYRTIDAAIARHTSQRTKMAVRAGGKVAITHITNITALHDEFCLLDIALETGRTHQIRVHLSHVGHGIIGDKTYPNRAKIGSLTEIQKTAVQQFSRQALHAHTLGFTHPETGEPIKVSTPLPADMAQLVAVLAS